MKLIKAKIGIYHKDDYHLPETEFKAEDAHADYLIENDFADFIEDVEEDKEDNDEDDSKCGDGQSTTEVTDESASNTKNTGRKSNK